MWKEERTARESLLPGQFFSKKNNANQTERINILAVNFIYVYHAYLLKDGAR